MRRQSKWNLVTQLPDSARFYRIGKLSDFYKESHDGLYVTSLKMEDALAAVKGVVVPLSQLTKIRQHSKGYAFYSHPSSDEVIFANPTVEDCIQKRHVSDVVISRSVQGGLRMILAKNGNYETWSSTVQNMSKKFWDDWQHEIVANAQSLSDDPFDRDHLCCRCTSAGSYGRSTTYYVYADGVDVRRSRHYVAKDVAHPCTLPISPAIDFQSEVRRLELFDESYSVLINRHCTEWCD